MAAVRYSEIEKSGTTVTFNTSIETEITSLKVYFSPIQEGSGDPSPENVREIEGWDGISVTNGTETISVQFPQTIYGGYVDLITGELVEEWEFASGTWGNIRRNQTNETTGLDMGDLFFNNQIISTIRASSAKNGICNVLSTISYTTQNNSSITIPHFYSYYNDTNNLSKAYIILPDSYDSDRIIQFCAKLANPNHYQIDPQTLYTLQGINTISSNTNGNIEVSYLNTSSKTMLDIRRNIIMGSPHTETVTSNIASFNTDMSAKLKSCKLKFLPIQNGSGDPSPTNKRRIVGLTSIKYRKTGRNLANVVSYSGVNQNMETASKTTNTYGTTLSTTEFTAPHGEVTITQANYSDNTQESYRNGYFTVQVHNLEYGKRYNVSFKVSDITNNPLNVNSLYIYGPNGSGGAWGTMIGNRMVFKHVGFNQPSNGTYRKYFEIRPCGMSFTLSDFMVTTVDDEDPTWEPYVGIEDKIMIPPKGKNIANFLGYSASTENVYGANKSSLFDLSGSYGQTINTTEYYPGSSLTITQTRYPQTNNLPHYQNGYFCAIPDNLEYGKYYIVSFDVDEITNNPLNATLSDMRVASAYGSFYTVTVNDNRVVSDRMPYGKNPNDPLFTKHCIDIRNCGMSMTISNIMVTADTETDQTYEPFEFGAYGGYIDLVNGEIVSEYGVIDLGDMDWSNSNSTYGSLVATDIQNLSNAFISRSEPGDMFCDKAKVVSTDTFNTVGNGEGECWIQINGSQTVYIMSTDFIGKNVNDVTNMVRGTQLVYRLAEPTRTLIDPESLKALRGANAIWTDSNDETSVTYYTH